MKNEFDSIVSSIKLRIVVRVIDVKYLLCISFSVNRGFGFITFADPASVDKVLAQGNHELDGKKVSIRKLSIYVTKIYYLKPRTKRFYLRTFLLQVRISIKSLDRMYILKFLAFPIIVNSI